MGKDPFNPAGGVARRDVAGRGLGRGFLPSGLPPVVASFAFAFAFARAPDSISVRAVVTGVVMERLQPLLRRTFRGLCLSPDFRRLWSSLPITAFERQITNLALALTAALLLQPTPLQMGLRIA